MQLFEAPPAIKVRRAAPGKVRLLVQRLGKIDLPAPAKAGDAGLDLCSTVAFSLPPGERRAVPTGIAVAIPPGYAGFVQPRSGLAARQGIGVLNSPGLVDSGYRGEIKVVLVNLDPTEPLEVEPGDRIAQLVVLAVPDVEVKEVDSLPGSERGEGGFGSTGR
jgi:dUTP pyrophosphatase